MLVRITSGRNVLENNNKPSLSYYSSIDTCEHWLDICKFEDSWSFLNQTIIIIKLLINPDNPTNF